MDDLKLVSFFHSLDQMKSASRKQLLREALGVNSVDDGIQSRCQLVRKFLSATAPTQKTNRTPTSENVRRTKLKFPLQDMLISSMKNLCIKNHFSFGLNNETFSSQ